MTKNRGFDRLKSLAPLGMMVLGGYTAPRKSSFPKPKPTVCQCGGVMRTSSDGTKRYCTACGRLKRL